MRIEVARRRPPLIRLTPLIDVVFILLVFFMLASSFLDWRAFEVAVPAPSGEVDPARDPVRIEVGADGALTVQGDGVSPDHLAAAVRAVQGDEAERRPVIVHAHDEAPVGATVGAFDRLQAGGIAGVSLSGTAP